MRIVGICAVMTGCYAHAVVDESWKETVEVELDAGEVGKMDIDIRADVNGMMVKVARARTCRSTKTRRATKTIDKRWDWVLMAPQDTEDKDYLEGDAQMARFLSVAILVPLWPVFAGIGIVSAVKTHFELAVWTPETTAIEPVIEEMEIDCGVPMVGVDVEVTLPSGRTIAGVTRDDGTIRIGIEDEPAGQARATALGKTVTTTLP
jgi:hypothetical protein